MSYPHLVYETDLSSFEIRLVREGDDLILVETATNARVVFGDYFAPGWEVQEIHLSYVEGVVLRRPEVDATLANDGLVPQGVNLYGTGTLEGTFNMDTLAAADGGATLLGHGGNDSFYGTRDLNQLGVVFEGGAGNDMFGGSLLGDTYRFNRGDGIDTIADIIDTVDAKVAFAADPYGAQWQDRIEFGAGISLEDVTFSRVFGTLRIEIEGTGDMIQVGGWYDNSLYNRIEEFVFADGTVLSGSHVDHMLGQWPVQGVSLVGGGVQQGTQYDDDLIATAYGTRLQGDAGDDVLQTVTSGGVFDLALVGGLGNDIIYGSYARDTYHYALGDGVDWIQDDVRTMGPDVAAFFAAHSNTDTYQDQLVFGAGITAADLSAERVHGDDLLLHVGEGSITVDGWFDGTMFNKIERFVFADGSTRLASDIDRLAGQASVGTTQSGSGALEGSQYDDSLTATGYGAALDGGAGHDTLAAATDGGVFDVVFDGGAGNDVIRGSYARDTYRFERGDGADVVTDDVRAMGPGIADYFQRNLTAGTYQDRFEFGAGIAVTDLRYSVIGSDLVVRINGTTDSIRFTGWNDGTLLNRIETFAFADGTTKTHAEIDWLAGVSTPGVTLSGGGTLTGTDSYDVLTATAYGTHLVGGAHSDRLVAAVDGGVFGLVFEGGAGIDYLRGSYAGDTYLYNRGDGMDVIHDDVRDMGAGVAAYFAANQDAASYQDQLVFGAGITASEVVATRTYDNGLSLRLGNSLDWITIEGWFDGTPHNKIERISFEDGTVWTSADIDHRLSPFYPGVERSGGGTVVGTEHRDQLIATDYGTRLEGGGGNDNLGARIDGSVFDVSFVGGAGNDYLNGSYARDFYYFNVGDGNDTIFDDVGSLSPQVAYYFRANPDAETYQDHLLFGEGISAADVTRIRDEDDLVLDLGNGDSVRVVAWFDGAFVSKIEVVGFADGTTWTTAMTEQGLV